MGKIAIVTDSNSGITQAQAEELGVYVIPMPFYRSEERRVGKECRSRWSPYH